MTDTLYSATGGFSLPDIERNDRGELWAGKNPFPASATDPPGVLIFGVPFRGSVALLGIPPADMAIDWNQVIFKGLVIKGIYGREMFETWYKMAAMLQSGLDVSGVITHRFPASDYDRAFETMGGGQSGKVILDSSSGNTGIAYAMIGAVKGYRVKIVIPESASAESSGNRSLTSPWTAMCTMPAPIRSRCRQAW